MNMQLFFKEYLLIVCMFQLIPLPKMPSYLVLYRGQPEILFSCLHDLVSRQVGSDSSPKVKTSLGDSTL